MSTVAAADPAISGAPSDPSLDWLISPVGRQEFFEYYWEKRPLVIINRDRPDYFARLLSFEEVDRVITTLDRRFPDICLKNAARPVGPDEYTMSGGALDVAKLYQLFQDGSTVTLAYLDTVIPALTRFCRSLEAEFSCPFQTNVYMTPPGAQGAAPHYDTHDVFVLQVAGSKQWTIFGTPVESPLPSQDFDPQAHELGAPTLEFELQAGDVAYIPRGVAHEARSTDTVSLHITTGILRYTWADLLLECVAAASLNDPAFRKALPPGFARSDFDRTAARETLGGLLARAANGSSFDPALDYFVDRFMSSCAPVLEGQMSQLAAVDSLSLNSLVGARVGVISRLESSPHSEIIHCYGRTITFPAYARDAVRFASANSSFAVRDLPVLDDAGKLTLIRRLIREGLLQALEIQQ
jgi:mannose-6-phosphate isomerase-like protein (cupin superfamily)